jgi:predicted anti-sigma-YlaC factor YlaD
VTSTTSGTKSPVQPTNPIVKCERFREAASARLDGEPIGMASSALAHHLTTCSDCARWNTEATRLTRLARLGTANVPDLAEKILGDAVLPARRVLKRRNRLRLGLVLVGLIQLAIAAPALFGTDVGMAMAVHASHEEAAWNVAVGIAMLATAVRPQRASGVLSVLATFVGVLALLSIRDVASGAVAVERLATHLAAVAGLVLVAGLSRAERALPPRADATGEDERSQGLRGVA